MNDETKILGVVQREPRVVLIFVAFGPKEKKGDIQELDLHVGSETSS